MKLKSCFLLPVVLLLPIGVIATACSDNVSSDEIAKIKQRALPSVRKYDDVSKEKFTVTNETRFIDCLDNNDFDSTYSILANEYYQKMLPTDNPLTKDPEIINGAAIKIHQHDIVVKLVPTLTKYTDVNSPEAYQLKIDSHIELSAISTKGVLWGMRTILQMQLVNEGLNYGLITDWPKVPERGIQYDFNGNDWPIEYLNETIREISWDKLNTLGLQFASGGVHIATGRTADPHTTSNPNQTWFSVEWPTTNEIKDFNINESDTNNWCWNDTNSPFAKSMKLANDYGITIIPQMEVFSHSTFITNLNAPRYTATDTIPPNKAVGDIKNDEDITATERNDDFALYDDSATPKRISDMVDLTDVKDGSKAALDLIKQMVGYYCDLFKTVGCDSFSIGADEYFESVLWSQGTDRQYTSIQHHPQGC